MTIQTRIIGIAGLLFLLCVLQPWGYALDLGFGDQDASTAGAQKTMVVNLPVILVEPSVKQSTVPNAAVGVTPMYGWTEKLAENIDLRYEEKFESPVYSVMQYRKVSFYVVPATVLPGRNQEVFYRLDAYFTVLVGDTVIKTFGDKKPAILNVGWQDFGAARMGTLSDESAPKEIASMVRLTTGETQKGVLSTEIYGPYVRFVLKNLTQGDKRKFDVYGYFTP